MAQQQQPTAEQLKAIQDQQNSNFMAFTYEQPILANALNNTTFAAGRTINFEAPIISGAYATKLIIHHEVEVDVELNGGTAALNAAAPYNFLSNIGVNFGTKQINMHPYLTKVLDKMEGYARTTQSQVAGDKLEEIDTMLDTVPTTLVEGSNTFVFESTIDLNQLHPQSVNGILPIYGTGTKLGVALQTAQSMTGADPLDHPIKTTGGATVTVGGNITLTVVFRDHNSMTTREGLQPDLTGLPTVQIINTPGITPLVGGTVQNQSIKNPYPFAKLISIVIDGKQSNKFSSPANLEGYAIEKAENSNSSFVRYDESTGGIKNYYKDVRQRFGQDMDPGVVVFDATTQNVANVSSKLGKAFLNFSGDGYPAGRLSYKVGSVSNSGEITPRVVTYGVILNPEGINQA